MRYFLRLPGHRVNSTGGGRAEHVAPEVVLPERNASSKLTEAIWIHAGNLVEPTCAEEHTPEGTGM
jgi:hypothetical protein